MPPERKESFPKFTNCAGFSSSPLTFRRIVFAVSCGPRVSLLLIAVLRPVTKLVNFHIKHNRSV